MTVYRRNPLLMTVMGANPGTNPGGPSFLVADSLTGKVMYTKRATGVGSEAISKCDAVAKRLARQNRRSYIVFLDIAGNRVGSEISVTWARVLGITEEVLPDGRVLRGNPPRRRKDPDSAVDSMIGAAWAKFMSGVQVSIMEIPKIFRDIKLEMAGGATLEDAVRSVGSRYRVNRNPGMTGAIVGGIAGALVNRAFQSNPMKSYKPFNWATLEACPTEALARGYVERFSRETLASALQWNDRNGSWWPDSAAIIETGAPTTFENAVEGMLEVWRGMRPYEPNPNMEGDPCPSCSGSLLYQGTLGDREHYRCRNCGIDVSRPVLRPYRSRGWKKTCGHGELTNRCEVCRGRKPKSTVKPCPHGVSGGGVRCVACQRLYRRGGPVKNNPAISRSWNGLKLRPRLAILEFAGIPYEQARRLAGRSWETLPPDICSEVSKGWQENGRRGARKNPAISANPGHRGKRRRMTMTIEKFANWVKSKRDPAMWKAFLAKFRGYEKWTHGSRAKKVTVEWVETPGVNGLWITYDGGKQPESTYIMPKGSKRKGAWKHPWDTMPDIKHDPSAGIVLTKLRGQSKITDFYHK